MDVSSMIKINELAKELVEKGFAASSEEATKMAQQFLQKDAVPDTSAKTGEHSEYGVLLERLQRRFNNETAALKEELAAVTNELRLMRDDIKRMRLNQTSKPAVMEEIKKRKLPDVKQSTLETKEKKPNQRTGSLKPGDVNIEDYFYYGDKKK